MNKFKFYISLLIISTVVFACQETTSTPEPIAIRPYAEQYAKDIDSITIYLKSHYIVKKMIDGQIDADILPLPADGSKVSIWDNTEFPLQHKIVKNDLRLYNAVDGRIDDQVDYKMYYIILNQGGGSNPATTDSTYTTYKGWKLNNKVFDSNSTPLWSTYPAASAGELTLISGYRQFVPLLKAASAKLVQNDGTVSFDNSGLGIVFLPSGLAYYSNYVASIPVYTPIVFKVGLHALRYRDHDRDGVMNADEDLNNDGDTFNDDSDGDNIPNFLDADDDGDLFLTRGEIKVNGVVPGYAQILDCSGTTTGIKKHLDKNCH